jgi:DUF917 family protein
MKQLPYSRQASASKPEMTLACLHFRRHRNVPVSIGDEQLEVMLETLAAVWCNRAKKCTMVAGMSKD